MEIAINDLSFSFLFYSEKQALLALHDFIYLCKEIESGNKCTGKNVYHGYIAEDLGDDIINGLSAHDWK